MPHGTKEEKRTHYLIQQMVRRLAQHLDDLVHLVQLVRPAEQGLPRVHLDQYTAQRPHVDGQVVRDA